MATPEIERRAMNAFQAQHEADVATKYCITLAQWVQYLAGQVHMLQGQVTELEDWKKKALDDVRKLRDEHKVLRRKVMGDGLEEPGELPAKSKTMPALPKEVARPPPGLVASPPPGLSAPPDVAQEDADAPAREPTSTSLATERTGASFCIGEGDSLLEGVQVTNAEVDGQPCELAEWRIGALSAKLKTCMGRALVSPPFAAAGVEDMRLMVYPEGKDAPNGPRNKRQKEIYAKKVLEGPLDCCLKLKMVPVPPNSGKLEYYLSVGTQRRGPFKNDFAENITDGCDDFGVDWLKQTGEDQSLTVRVEILKEAAAGPAGATS